MVLNHHRPVFILTGETGSGKTTYLMKLVGELREETLSIAGIAALSVQEDGPSGSYNILDLVSGKILPLASRRFSEGWIQMGNFHFNPDGIQMGKKILEDPLINNNDLIVIDEVGPFELDGKVWADDLTHLLSVQKYAVLLVVREQLVGQVIEKWKLKDAVIFDIGQVKPHQLSDAILSRKSRT